MAWQICRRQILPLAVAGVAVTVATLAFRLATTRFGISLKKLAPDAARFNPISKLSELPRQNLPSLVQALVLLPLFLWAVYVVARDKLDDIPGAAAGERRERLPLSQRLADGAVLEGRRGVPDLRLRSISSGRCAGTSRICA